ncbi:ATP-grasp domain-containing protein [Myxacorys almedinensis]|uniref:Succinate--CoA ligase subunit beta n=1 Tax=Myxacorys almedinensis A TaxID=2690445 RepID=A0A8J8CN05_9CYAN|nr:ATP-grasp domain-containing protein [Myxacorys almedinensis]NDJ19130.1 succinate--CoA ligase subunit beta [Myxacorys almedinensis A]
MDLLEYQAKELFRDAGIPVPAYQRIDRPADLKSLTIPYPIAIKSQVYMGGRGRLGGVRMASNTIDAIAAAHTIFNLPIMGELPKVLLAEAKFEIDQELYLAVVLNRSIRRPVLLGSAQGGIDVQTAIAQMQQVVVDQEFSPFYARRLVLKMGLSGDLLNAVTDVIERMYRLFLNKDLDLVEINPLAVNTAGEVMALDGKVSANDAALGRHPALAALDMRSGQGATLKESRPPGAAWLPDVLSTVDPDGQIGVLANGAGLTMATMDLVCQAGGKPLNCLNIGGETRSDALPEDLCERLEQGLELLSRNKQIKVILVNIVSGTLPCSRVTQAIAKFLQRPVSIVRSVNSPHDEVRLSRVKPFPSLVVRLVGVQLQEAELSLAKTPAIFVEDLDQAITQTLSLVRKREP